MVGVQNIRVCGLLGANHLSPKGLATLADEWKLSDTAS